MNTENKNMFCKVIHVTLNTVKILVIVVLVFVFLIMLPWLMIACGAFLEPDPPKPEATYGEFPFELVYEMDGQQIEISDTLVIEYSGVGYNEGVGKYNKWNAYWKESECTPGYPTSIELFSGFVEGIGSVTIAYKLGSCEYYMGLDEVQGIYIYNDVNPGDIFLTSPKENKVITDEELYSRFSIRIISKSLSSPIS